MSNTASNPDISVDAAFAVVRDILVEQCECAPAAVTMDARLVENLALESMGLMILLTELENHYRVRVDVQSETGLATVGDIARLIAERAGAGADENPEPIVIGGAQNAGAGAELAGPPLREPEFETVLEAWTNVTTDEDIGITFHTLRGDTLHYSYQRLLAKSQRIAAGLAERGVRPGDRVAIVLPTSPDFVACFFGIMLARAVAAPLYPPMTAQGMAAWQERTAALLKRLAPRLAIIDQRLQEPFDRMTREIVPEEFAGNLTPSALDSDAQFVAGHPRPDDIAFIQFSSGTTVDPKPVALSHRNLMANITAIGERYREHEEPRRHNLCWAPLYHDLGLIGNVLVPVVWSAHNELFPPQDFVARPWLWLQRLSSTGATLTAAPNFAFHLCLKRVQDRHLEGVDLAHVRIALNCAEPIHPGTVRAFEERFAKFGWRPGTIIPAYGLAEVSLAATIAPMGSGLSSAYFDRKALEAGRAVAIDANHANHANDANGEQALEIASGGTPIMGTTIRIADREHPARLLGENRVGEILVRSPSVLAGYFQGDGTVGEGPGEWLPTGDLGFLHEGRLYVSGRKKDLIIYNGRNLYPQHLEECVSQVEGVRDGLCAALAYQAGDHEELLIFAEARDKLLEDRAPAGELARAIAQAVLGEHGLRPDAVHLLDKHTIPRTTSGKVRRSRTLDLFREGAIKPRFSLRPREEQA